MSYSLIICVNIFASTFSHRNQKIAVAIFFYRFANYLSALEIMKNLKRITLIVLMSVLTSNMFAQNTVYFDTHANKVVTKEFASKFDVDRTVKDTLFFADSTVMVRGGVSTFTHNIRS